jgi:CRISPR system Cascade subunit CasC
MQSFGIELGVRTKKVEQLMVKACIEAGASEEQAQKCSESIAKALSDDTLLFISHTEAKAFAEHASELEFDARRLTDNGLAGVARRALNPAVDSLDIALFGRMVAKAANMNVEAAASFAHAISTHRVSNEVEFFTALDDLSEEPGSAHMGSLEFNSATYYRYISLDLGQLAQSLGLTEAGNSEDLQKAIAAFTQALFVAVPSARQTTQSGASPWEFARVLVRKGQRLQVPFEQPVKAKGAGFLQPSIKELKDYLDKKEKMTGSMFGKLAVYDWGEDENYSVDQLITDLQSHV